jgi:folate-binding protein YgfZ
MNAAYTQVAEYAGWLDLTDCGVMRLFGADRLRFLQGQTTNDLRDLREGQGVYTAFCTPTGQLLSNGYVLEAEDGFLLVLPAETWGEISARLSEAIILDDVVLMPLQEGMGLLSVQGGAADEVLEEVGLDAPPHEPLSHHTRLWQKAEIRLVRNDRTGFGGVDLLVPYAVMEELQTALVATACLPIDDALATVLRYEAGIPQAGVDWGERTLAAEMGEPFIRRHISYTKGCYVGQEVLMRIHARGHTNRSWVPLQVQGEILPPRGTPLAAPDRADVGWITGAVHSPALGGAILAWGFVRNEYTAPDTRLQVATEPHATVLRGDRAAQRAAPCEVEQARPYEVQSLPYAERVGEDTLGLHPIYRVAGGVRGSGVRADCKRDAPPTLRSQSPALHGTHPSEPVPRSGEAARYGVRAQREARPEKGDRGAHAALGRD